nr:tRNA lysidine(34) synthetase TilS [Aestuariivita boseongensis]
MTKDHTDIIDRIHHEFRANPPARLGVAVSGGSDSVALLHALAQACPSLNTQLFAVTVDHGLRAEAAQEAEEVARIAASLNVPHHILRWEGRDGSGNLQAQAREARYRLMTRWARDNEIAVLALGHTADDQAETVLMRLARSSGVDGLAGIPRRRVVHGVTIVRPFLDLTRAALRAYLKDHGVSWIEDPSNDDPRFDRVRLRAAAPQLAELGLTAQALSDVAHNMARAREALDWYTFIAAREAVQLDGGDVLIDRRHFRTLPEEIARRLLTRALCWIGGGPYQPRREAVSDALAAIRGGKTTTLHGCLLMSHAGLVWICREYNAVRELSVAATETWDRRWKVAGSGPVDATLTLRALGKGGLKQCGDWRQTGRPYAALVSAPSIWEGDRLVAAPKAGMTGKIGIELIGGGEEFFASILSH